MHEFGRLVILQTRDHAETIAQRSCKRPCLRRRADQCEGRNVKADGACTRPLADDDVEREVLHRRVQHLLDASGKPVYLINEEHIALAEIRQERREIA